MWILSVITALATTGWITTVGPFSSLQEAKEYWEKEAKPRLKNWETSFAVATRLCSKLYFGSDENVDAIAVKNQVPWATLDTRMGAFK